MRLLKAAAAILFGLVGAAEAQSARLLGDWRTASQQLTLKAGEFNGYGGCNRIGGRFTVAGASIRFDMTFATRRFCNPGSAGEARFLAALAAVRSYRLASGRLVLLDAAGAVRVTLRRG